MENKNGLMEKFIKEHGKKIKLLVKWMIKVDMFIKIIKNQFICVNINMISKQVTYHLKM